MDATNIYINTPLEISSECNISLPKCCENETTEEKKIEKILDVSKTIWKQIIKYYVDNNAANEVNTELLLSNLQIEYSDFFKSFPLILRWMVQMKQFKIKTFKEYLKIFINKKISSKIEFLKLQGEYIVMLYKELNPLCTKEQLSKYEDDINSFLIKEDDDFKQIEEEAKKEIEMQEKNMSEERKRKIYNMLMRKKINAEAKDDAIDAATGDSAN